MTSLHTDVSPYFVIAIVKPSDKRELKSMYKRFVNRNMKELEQMKSSKMFQSGRFKELKGAELTPTIKKDFIKTFCQNNALEIYYIIIDNKKVDTSFYDNTARAFNFCIKSALKHFVYKDLLPNDSYTIQIDERNQKTQTKFMLEEYLNTELNLAERLVTNPIKVEYFDSCNNHLIQVADVFANIYYSYLMTMKHGTYKDEISTMISQNYIKKVFKFPR